MVTPSVPELGARVRVDSHGATIRYVGEVAGQAGSWVGLEWDLETRGKNDGSTGGVQYFACRGRSGSFVKLQKFLQVAEFGKSLPDALQQRYQSIADPSADADLSIRTVTSKQLAVKLVGRDKVLARQGQLDQLLAANLTSCSVATVGASGELAAVAPNLSELDLASNPLRDWNEVAKLADELPGLRMLNVSSCRLQFGSTPPEPGFRPFQQLQTLVLNGTGVSWQQIQAIEPYLPGLTELHLCSNGMEAPAQELSGFQQLKVLSLDHNDLRSWAAAKMLGSLPSLISLSLAANNISSVQPLPSDRESSAVQSSGSTVPFHSLQTLLLADNALSAWSDVDALDTFPALQEARLTGNAVFSQPNARAEVIARVGALSRLNGSSISRPERKDAELQYLRTLTAHLEALGINTAAGKAMAAANPRLKALQDKFGNVGAAAINQKQGSVMRAGLVTLTLKCEASGMTHTKRLPGSLTIGKLKVLCERLFRIPMQAQVLTLHEEGRQPAAFGEDDGTTISMFDIQGTAEVTVQQQDLQADAAAAALAKQQAKQQHEERMRQHDKDIELMKRIQEQHYTLSPKE